MAPKKKPKIQVLVLFDSDQYICAQYRVILKATNKTGQREAHVLINKNEIEGNTLVVHISCPN